MSAAALPFRLHARGHERAGRAAVLLVLLASTGCSSTPEVPPPPCPRVGFLYGLDRFEGTADGGGSGSFTARLEGLRGGCVYEEDGVALRYTIDVRVRPRGTGLPKVVDLPYFVAVLDPDGRVLDKKVYTAHLVNDGSRPEPGVREEISQKLFGVNAERGPLYEVVIGFDLPRDRAIEQWRRRGL